MQDVPCSQTVEDPMSIPAATWPRQNVDRELGAIARALLILLRRLTLTAEGYKRKRRLAADVRYLQSFDDRMLADIGLTRADIGTSVRSRATLAAPRSLAPTRYPHLCRPVTHDAASRHVGDSHEQSHPSR